MQDIDRTVSDARIDPAAAGTRITYPSGGIGCVATVVGVARVVGAVAATAVVLDLTAAHPLSPTWPDQPADRGMLRTPAGDHPLLDVRQGVLRADGLHIDAPRAEGAGVVVHLVDPAAVVELGDTVEVVVDATFRRALSLAHSACHLNALALDAALEPYWNKPVATDPLGHPAFDRIAIASSTLSPHRAVDVYRLGKSLRKKGFDAARLAADLDAVQRVHAEAVARWVTADAPLHVASGDGTLAARRSWCCRLDGTVVVIPCGGTHATSTGELAGITATYELSPALDELVVTTTVPGDWAVLGSAAAPAGTSQPGRVG